MRFVVADRGPGVADADRDRIFERFYRGQASGQRGVADGTGLGLSLVAEHVRLHGGRVWVEPGGNGETRFVFELPTGERRGALAPHTTARAAPAPAPVSPSTPDAAPEPEAARAPDAPVT